MEINDNMKNITYIRETKGDELKTKAVRQSGDVRHTVVTYPFLIVACQYKQKIDMIYV